MIFYSSARTRTRGAPSETYTFLWFRRAPPRPHGSPRRKKSHPPGRMGAYAFSSMADHANPLEGVTFSRCKLSHPPTHNHHADPSFVKCEAKTPEGLSLRKGRQATSRTNDETAPTAPSPRTPHSARDVSQKRARGAGAGDVCSTSPRPLSSRFLTTATNQEHSHVSRPQAHHAGPPGGGGLPLPAAAAVAP